MYFNLNGIKCGSTFRAFNHLYLKIHTSAKVQIGDVTIGTRSVIVSGSIVTKDIPSDCIAVGNPCKVIKSITY